MEPGKHNMYYVAIVCTGESAQKIAKYKQWMKEQFGCTVALKSPAHITLVSPFWMDEAREEELKQVTQSFESNIEEFEIHLDGFDHFGNRVLFAQTDNSPELQQIKQEVEAHFIKHLGTIIKADERPFHPHVTIANRDLKPGDLTRAWGHFSKIDLHESFKATTISLLKLSPGKWNIISEKYVAQRSQGSPRKN